MGMSISVIPVEKCLHRFGMLPIGIVFRASYTQYQIVHSLGFSNRGAVVNINSGRIEFDNIPASHGHVRLTSLAKAMGRAQRTIYLEGFFEPESKPTSAGVAGLGVGIPAAETEAKPDAKPEAVPGVVDVGKAGHPFISVQYLPGETVRTVILRSLISIDGSEHIKVNGSPVGINNRLFSGARTILIYKQCKGN